MLLSRVSSSCIGVLLVGDLTGENVASQLNCSVCSIGVIISLSSSSSSSIAVIEIVWIGNLVTYYVQKLAHCGTIAPVKSLESQTSRLKDGLVVSYSRDARPVSTAFTPKMTCNCHISIIRHMPMVVTFLYIIKWFVACLSCQLMHFTTNA
jgi:hypothetical protein